MNQPANHHDHASGRDHGRDSGQTLASHGLRATRQRLAILDALCATKEHPTAEQLFVTVNDRLDGMSLATVYNTLEAFCRVGLAMKIPTPSGTARYDATADQHVHARLEPTGQMVDLPEDLNAELLGSIPAQLLQRIEHHLGGKVQQINVELVVQK